MDESHSSNPRGHPRIRVVADRVDFSRPGRRAFGIEHGIGLRGVIVWDDDLAHAVIPRLEFGH
jgi:hypothetical protein